MLRILRTVPFFAPAYGYGGPVIHTLNISKIQALMGYDVRVFASNILTNDVISRELPKFEIVNGVKKVVRRTSSRDIPSIPTK